MQITQQFGGTIPSVPINKYLEVNKDVYVYLYERQYSNETQKNETKLIMAPQKITRPAASKIGTRMKGYFFSDKTSTFLWEPSEDTAKRKMKLKIGTITDISILRAMQKGESDALSKLMTYAKNAKNPMYTGTVPVGESGTITKNMNILNEAYYYVYMQLEDENGKYYPVEDVSLYQGLVSSKIGKNLFDYLSDEFKWNLGDEPTATPTKAPTTPTPSVTKGKDNTLVPGGKIPQAGEPFTICAVIAGVVVLAVVFGIKFRKYNY